MKAFHRIPSRSERPSPMVPTLHIFKPWTGHGMSTELLGQQTSLCILELDRLHDMQASVQQLAPTINLFQNIQRHEMLEVSLHFSLHLSLHLSTNTAFPHFAGGQQCFNSSATSAEQFWQRILAQAHFSSTSFSPFSTSISPSCQH